MTYYLGSKANHADEILKIVLAKRKPGQTYVEPFVGGANVICRVPDADGPRIGADINPYMVALHAALADGWDPPQTLLKKTYDGMKRDPSKFPPELVGFVVPAHTMGSTWFGGGFIRDEDRCSLARKAALRDAPRLKGVRFICAAYDALDNPPESLIYCDPPYIGIQGYQSESQDKWRAYKFWQWADKMVDEGHTVFVSEYTGPSSEAYPTPPKTAEHDQTLAAFRALQAEINKTETTPPDMRAKLDDLYAEIKDHEAKRRDPCAQMAARWKVVWQKEVKVAINAVGTDTAKGEQAKTETEKLFHREA